MSTVKKTIKNHKHKERKNKEILKNLKAYQRSKERPFKIKEYGV
jgi:hypothetical protein